METKTIQTPDQAAQPNIKMLDQPEAPKITNFYFPNTGTRGFDTTQKTFVTDTTVFKLLVFFSHKESGRAYTQAEIENNDNRKYIESFDMIPTINGKWYIRHDLGLQKLRVFYNEYRERIMRSMLFVNEFETKKQYRIGNFYKNKQLNYFLPPKFLNCLESKQCFYDGLYGIPKPEFTYHLIQRTIKYTDRYIMLK